MENILYKKGWVAGTNPAHIEPPTNTLVKETYTLKSDGDCVKLKLSIDPTYMSI